MLNYFPIDLQNIMNMSSIIIFIFINSTFLFVISFWYFFFFSFRELVINFRHLTVFQEILSLPPSEASERLSWAKLTKHKSDHDVHSLTKRKYESDLGRFISRWNRPGIILLKIDFMQGKRRYSSVCGTDFSDWHGIYRVSRDASMPEWQIHCLQ